MAHQMILGETLINEGVVYACTLENKNSIGSNKFYVMKIIYDGENYYFTVRYGRIGDYGNVVNKSFTSKNDAIKAFEKQYKLKTRNVWNTVFVQQQNFYIPTNNIY
jgi:predicted DNA-binding WGR domain protein